MAAVAAPGSFKARSHGQVAAVARNFGRKSRERQVWSSRFQSEFCDLSPSRPAAEPISGASEVI